MRWEIALAGVENADATAARMMLVSQSHLRRGSQPWWVELPMSVPGHWAGSFQPVSECQLSRSRSRAAGGSWVRRGVLGLGAHCLGRIEFVSRDRRGSRWRNLLQTEDWTREEDDVELLS